MVVRYLEQTTREMHVSSREGQLEKPFSGGAAVMGKFEGQGRRICGGCGQRTTKGQCSRGDKYGMTRSKRVNNPKEMKKVRDRPSRTPRRILWNKGPRQEEVLHERKSSQRASLF